MKKILGLTSILLATGFTVFGTTIAPSYGSFGTLSGANFGGSGIPNNAVAITTIGGPNTFKTITLGLTATQRYSNPALGNDGAGTFSATTGENDGFVGASPGPTWNVDFYVSLTENFGSTTAYGFQLQYGNNTTEDFQTFSFGPASNTPGIAQNSWNLDMSFLGGINFDANAAGVYAFELDALDSKGNIIGKTAINVDVAAANVTPNSVPDGGFTVLFLGLGFVGLVAFGIKQKRQAVAK